MKETTIAFIHAEVRQTTNRLKGASYNPERGCFFTRVHCGDPTDEIRN